MEKEKEEKNHKFNRAEMKVWDETNSKMENCVGQRWDE